MYSSILTINVNEYNRTLLSIYFIVQLFSPDNKDKKFTTLLVHSGIRTLLEFWFKTSQFSLIIIIFSIRTLLHIILLYCSYYTVQYIQLYIYSLYSHIPVFLRASLITLYSLYYCLLACQSSFSLLTFFQSLCVPVLSLYTHYIITVY